MTPWFAFAFDRARSDGYSFISTTIDLDDDRVRALMGLPAGEPVHGIFHRIDAADVATIQPFVWSEIDLATHDWALGDDKAAEPLRTWFACAFRKTGRQHLHHRIRTRGLPHDLIRELWDPPDHDPLFGSSYPIDQSHVAQLQPFVPEPMDLDSYSWFLSDAANEHEPG